MLITWLLISLLSAVFSVATGLVSTIGAAALAFLLCFLGLLLLWAAIGSIASLFVDIRVRNKRDSPFFRFYANGIVEILMFALRIRLQVTGMEKITTPQFLLVCNHRSAFDPILEMGLFRKYRLGFVSKPENFRIPVIGKIMHRCSCVSLDRDDPRKAIETISQASENIASGNVAMGIYPEGTRNKGSGLLPFKPGAFKIAKKAACQIVVAVIQNTEQIMKNAPIHKTRVQLNIIGVLDENTVRQNTTVQLSEMVHKMMEDEMCISNSD